MLTGTGDDEALRQRFETERQTLDRFVTLLALEARLRSFLAIYAVVQHAHERFVADSDLEPSNILVTHEGIPQWIGFGIARWVADPLRRFERSWMPGCANPKQLRGDVLMTTTRVYARSIPLATRSQGSGAIGVHHLLDFRIRYGSFGIIVHRCSFRTPDGGDCGSLMRSDRVSGARILRRIR